MEISKENLDRLKRARLMDDSFMRKYFEGDIERVEYVLRIILDRDDLKVQEVHTQDSKSNILYRSAVLDILATDKKGEVYNIEIQRKEDGAGFRRTRYYRSILDVSLIDKGDDFEELPEIYIIFITERDVIGGGKALYTLKKQLECETETYQFDDGEHILYVNGSYDKTDTPLGQLIHDFNCADPRKMFSELLREKAIYYKEGKEGVASMCRLWEEAKAEGKAEGKNEAILGLLENGLEVEFIAKALKVDIERVRKLKERLEN